MKTNTSYYAAVALCILSNSVFAKSTSDTFKGNWTEKFDIGSGDYILHTPTFVSINDSIIVGSGINLNKMTINGRVYINLHLFTNSTREEFVAALCQTNLSVSGISCSNKKK